MNVPKAFWSKFILIVPRTMILLTPALRAQLYTGTVTGTHQARLTGLPNSPITNERSAFYGE